MPEFLISSQDFEPAYLRLYHTGELEDRARQAIESLASCRVCPRDCRVDRLGDKTGSLAEMREVVKIAPKLAEGHLMLGRGLLDAGEPLDEVQAEVEEGLSLAETSELKALGYFLLADVYNRRGDAAGMSEALKNANRYKSKKE